MKIQMLQHLLLYRYHPVDAIRLGIRVVVGCQTADMGCGPGLLASCKETATFMEDRYFTA